MFTLREINEEIRNDPHGFINSCEEAYHEQLKNLADEISQKSGRRLVMLAGPSSSGKTTSAALIKEYLKQNSRNAVVISLDDFYKNKDEMFFFEDGTPDYERIDALDRDYISDCLSSLSEKGECLLPKFNFLTGKREEELVKLEISENDIVIVEGLHAINPLITDELDPKMLFKIYVSVSSRIMKDGNTFLSKRDLRFIRRLIRDFHHRASSVEQTFFLWKAVRMGEDRYLFPFTCNAERKIDSIHPYEPCLFKNEAIRLLDQTAPDSVYYKTAKELISKLSQFEDTDKLLIPVNSLLNEFLE